MQGAQKEGTIASEPRLFVRNQLVAIVPAANPAQVMRLQDLAKPGVKLVLTNKEVPVGNYSRQALAKMSQDAAFGSEFADPCPGQSGFGGNERQASRGEGTVGGGGRRHCLFK